MSTGTTEGQRQRTLLTDREWASVESSPEELGPEFENETFPCTGRSLTVRFADDGVVLEAPWSEQLEPALERLRDLLSLQANQDICSGGAVKAECVAGTVLALLELQEESVPQPELTPMSDGTIQLEWHGAETHVQVEVYGPSCFSYTVEDAAFEQEGKASSVGELKNVLRPVLQRLAEQRRDDEDLIAKSADAARCAPFTIEETEELIRRMRFDTQK